MNIFRKDGQKKPLDIADDTREIKKNSEKQTDINELLGASQPAADEHPKMEEIYSTRDKHVRYKSETPIEFEQAQKRQQQTKEELRRGDVELAMPEDEPAPEVELKPELSPDTVVADEVIEDVVDVKTLRNVYVQDIDDIDISLDPSENLKDYERRANDTVRHDLRNSEQGVPYSADKVVAYVPVYRHESAVEKITLKAGRFTDVVESEYDEYLKSTDPTISKNYRSMYKEVKPKQSLLYTLSQMAERRHAEIEKAKKPAPTDKSRENFDKDEPETRKPKRRGSSVKRFFTVMGMILSGGFSKDVPDVDPQQAVDYNSREDEMYVLAETKDNIGRWVINIMIYIVIAALLLILAALQRMEGASVFSDMFAHGEIIYVAINFILLLVLGVIGRDQLRNGLLNVKMFRGNADTAMALAYAGCLIQAMVSLFTADSFVRGEHHLYGFVIAFAFILNAAGRLFMALRVKSNFRFITSKSPAYAAKIYNDEETSRRMISGTSAGKGVVAYQHVTSFLSDFLKISYAPDPSEEIMSKLSPITMISSLFVAIIYAIIFKSIPGAFSALAVMLCISVPFSAMLGGNLPMMLFSRKMLRYNAMVAGYPSVRQFCDTDAVMASSSELFPKGSVKLVTMETYQDFRVEEALLNAAIVMQEADSPMHQIFDDLLDEHMNNLPTVESVMYEDKSGLVGWVGGDRILIGNMSLMDRYHISVPESDIESRNRAAGRQVTYIAAAGRLLAVVVTVYKANPYIREQLQKGERTGLALVISTTDVNVTSELIAQEYGLFYRTVKVVPTGYASVIDETTTKVEETSRAYLATRGRLSSLVRSIAGCIGLRSNITVGIVIQLFGLLLGVLLCATMALYASVARLGVFELMIYVLFWTAATIVGELIKRP